MGPVHWRDMITLQQRYPDYEQFIRRSTTTGHSFSVIGLDQAHQRLPNEELKAMVLPSTSWITLELPACKLIAESWSSLVFHLMTCPRQLAKVTWRCMWLSLYFRRIGNYFLHRSKDLLTFDMQEIMPMAGFVKQAKNRTVPLWSPLGFIDNKKTNRRNALLNPAPHLVHLLGKGSLRQQSVLQCQWTHFQYGCVKDPRGNRVAITTVLRVPLDGLQLRPHEEVDTRICLVKDMPWHLVRMLSSGQFILMLWSGLWLSFRTWNGLRKFLTIELSEQERNSGIFLHKR